MTLCFKVLFVIGTASSIEASLFCLAGGDELPMDVQDRGRMFPIIG
jgi:hypothetical protein